MSAFALTWLIETIVYLAAFTSLGWLDRRARRPLSLPGALLLVLALNLISHPVLWLLASATTSLGALLLAEIGVVVVEGTVIALVRRGSWVWAYSSALLANACSFAVGLGVAALSAGGSAACC